MMYVNRQVRAETKYIGQDKTCKRCWRSAVEYFYESSGPEHDDVLCTKCKYELNPPKMQLQLMIEHGIWNVTQRRFEKKMSIKDFQECGWFVRKIVKQARTVKLVPKNLGSDNVFLEYFGHVRCLRVARHKFYPSSFGICGMDACVIQEIGG